ncbi:MAG: helix-turn-helix domain-containing protein [Actinomycetota bacterium]
MSTTKTNASELPHLLTVTALADHLGVDIRHIRRLVAERRIPFIKWGHLLRFDPVEIADWIDQNRRHPGKPRV